MDKITTTGLDTAKNVFHAVCCDARGKVVRRRMLKRKEVLEFFARLEPGLIGLEACASAHHWARQLTTLGHEVRLVPPQYVKAYLRGNKNDYNDALAISEAVTRPQMRFVAIKTAEQQDLQALHRLRERSVKMRTGLCNQIRALVGEYGLVCAKGISTLRRQIPQWLEDGENGLSDVFRRLLSRSYQQLQTLDEDIDFYTRELKRHSQQDDACQRLQTIPGFGPIVASAFHSHVGNGENYRRGRDVSASIGLVPRQHSSGGKDTLLGISKRGNRQLRSLLVHGARAVVSRAEKKDDPLSCWVSKIRAERGVNKATVALANKLARIGWAVLAHNTVYRPVPQA
ncbi:MAG TPA: IS110 family transposase [Gammaproteobacteria bacterium]|nr:IS110 family transposase [Gammaproteobacteria bacterium]